MILWGRAPVGPDRAFPPREPTAFFSSRSFAEVAVQTAKAKHAQGRQDMEVELLVAGQRPGLSVAQRRNQRFSYSATVALASTVVTDRWRVPGSVAASASSASSLVA